MKIRLNDQTEVTTWGYSGDAAAARTAAAGMVAEEERLGVGGKVLIASGVSSRSRRRGQTSREMLRQMTAMKDDDADRQAATTK